MAVDTSASALWPGPCPFSRIRIQTRLRGKTKRGRGAGAGSPSDADSHPILNRLAAFPLPLDSVIRQHCPVSLLINFLVVKVATKQKTLGPCPFSRIPLYPTSRSKEREGESGGGSNVPTCLHAYRPCCLLAFSPIAGMDLILYIDRCCGYWRRCAYPPTGLHAYSPCCL